MTPCQIHNVPMHCPKCVKAKLMLWDGTREEFWRIINRYIRHAELEADWNTLNEVLELALLSLPYAPPSPPQVSEEVGTTTSEPVSPSCSQAGTDQAPGERDQD